jgi:hypothetical protein
MQYLTHNTTMIPIAHLYSFYICPATHQAPQTQKSHSARSVQSQQQIATGSRSSGAGIMMPAPRSFYGIKTLFLRTNNFGALQPYCSHLGKVRKVDDAILAQVSGIDLMTSIAALIILQKYSRHSPISRH